MDFKPENPDSANTESTSDTVDTVSRRVITAVLVLVAALLLGYVLYDVLLSGSNAEKQPTATGGSELTETAGSGDEDLEYSTEEKQVVLDAMQESDEPEVDFAETQRREALQGMEDDDSSDVPEEDKRAIMEAMQ